MLRLNFTVNKFAFFFGLLFCLIISADVVKACTCFTPGLLFALDESKNVAVFSVQSVEKYTEGEKGYGYGGFKQAVLKVEKVYKGNLKTGEQISFRQGGGGDCIFTFDEKSVGMEMLLFLDKRPAKNKLWEAFICSRSQSKKYASADLLYLEKMSKMRNKTRLSGILTKTIEPSIKGNLPTVDFLAGIKVKITRQGKNIELKTDENGVYEIYDLPPGKYLVTPEKLSGFKFSDDETFEEVEIEEEDHQEQDFEFEVDNRVSGKLYDLNGKPLEKVCLEMIPVQGEKPKSYNLIECTDNDGFFEFTEIPPGNYIIVINSDGKATVNEIPLGTFYYPNVYRREAAAKITVGAGTFFDNLNIKIPPSLDSDGLNSEKQGEN